MLCISQISQLTSLFDFCWSLFNLLCSLNKFFTEWVYLYDCVCIYRHGCFDVKKTVFVCWLSILRQCKTVQQGAMHESFTPPFTANYPQIKLQKGFLIEFLNAYTYLTYLWWSMPLNKPFSSFTNRPDPFFLWYFLFCGVIKKNLSASPFFFSKHGSWLDHWEAPQKQQSIKWACTMAVSGRVSSQWCLLPLTSSSWHCTHRQIIL